MDASFLDQILDMVGHLEGMQAYIAIFSILFACGLGLPIPEDITLVTAGYLAYLENIELSMAISVCLVGVLVGDFTLFTFGRLFGKRLLTTRVFRYIITPERVALAQARLKKNERKVVFVARFLAGLRGPIYFSAGMLGVKPITFFSLDGLAAIISVPLLTYLGYYFGDEIELGLHYMRRAERYIMISLAIIGLYVVLRSIFKNRSETT